MPLRGQLLERGAQLAIGGFRELGELHVAGFLVDHERAADGGDIHLVAHDIHVDQVVRAATAQGDVDLRALGSLESLDGLVARPALGILGLDLRDHVAPAQPLLERRRPLEDRHDGDVAVDDLDRDAEPVIAAMLALAHLRVGLRIEEARVRVQRLQHAVDGAVDEPIGRQLLDVVALDGREREGKHAIMLCNLVLRLDDAVAEHAAQDRRQKHGHQRRRENSGSPHKSHRNRPSVTRATTSGRKWGRQRLTGLVGGVL